MKGMAKPALTLTPSQPGVTEALGAPSRALSTLSASGSASCWEAAGVQLLRCPWLQARVFHSKACSCVESIDRRVLCPVIPGLPQPRARDRAAACEHSVPSSCPCRHPRAPCQAAATSHPLLGRQRGFFPLPWVYSPSNASHSRSWEKEEAPAVSN